MTLLVDELANELRQYRHSPMASGALAEHILAIPRIHDALEAQGIEAAEAAETVKLGSVHESPVLEEDAPKAKPVTNQQEG